MSEVIQGDEGGTVVPSSPVENNESDEIVVTDSATTTSDDGVITVASDVPVADQSETPVEDVGNPVVVETTDDAQVDPVPVETPTEVAPEEAV